MPKTNNAMTNTHPQTDETISFTGNLTLSSSSSSGATLTVVCTVYLSVVVNAGVTVCPLLVTVVPSVTSPVLIVVIDEMRPVVVILLVNVIVEGVVSVILVVVEVKLVVVLLNRVVDGSVITVEGVVSVEVELVVVLLNRVVDGSVPLLVTAVFCSVVLCVVEGVAISPTSIPKNFSKNLLPRSSTNTTRPSLISFRSTAYTSLSSLTIPPSHHLPSNAW